MGSREGPDRCSRLWGLELVPEQGKHETNGVLKRKSWCSRFDNIGSRPSFLWVAAVQVRHYPQRLGHRLMVLI